MVWITPTDHKGVPADDVDAESSLGRLPQPVRCQCAEHWRDITFKRILRHFGPPWFLPFAGSYYKFQDLIK